ncbi:MAG: DNA repair protein RadC [Candidatus Krumholzibacteriota bacterium]|nr:DNA repair protein RadC [Candidatus Krumholzibacteriota bacterium]
MRKKSGLSLETLRSKGYFRGFDRIGDSELIALVLGPVAFGSSCSIAQELVDRYGSLEEVGSAGLEELMDIRGIGRAGAIRIKASFEIGKRSIVSSRKKELRKVRGPEDVAWLMIPEMKGLDREHFKALLLDTRNGILKIVTVAIGSLNAALVHPREIFKAAVLASAAGIIIVHNHPTGNPEPSREDKELTKRFNQCGDLMGIDLVDHIIVGDDSFVSLRERGLFDI